MSRRKATVRPATRQRLASVDAEIGHLHKTHALLIATQFATNHGAEFDVSDALAVIRDRVEQSIMRLDEAQTAEATERPKGARHGRK